MLYITGDVYPGNFSWGRYLPVYLVFLLSLSRFGAICSRPESWHDGWKPYANLVLTGLVVLHLYAGIRYYLEALTYVRW